MKRNMSKLDQVVRLTFGFLLLYAAFSMVENIVLASAIAIFSLLNLFSATTAHCPVYAAMKISSNNHKNSEEDPADIAGTRKG